MERAVRAEKGFPLFISNQDMNDIIKIINSLEYLSALIVKPEMKKQEGGFLGALLALLTTSLVQFVIYSVV